MFWIATVAVAGSIAGLGVPGGGFAHPAEEGAFGLPYAPTAALSAPAPELLLDVGLLGSHLRTELDVWTEPLTGASVSPVPTLAVAVPLGPVALGALFQVPYARGGGGDPAGPQRFYSGASSLRLLEQQLTAAVRPVDALALGAGLRVGELSYRATRSIDTAAMLNSSLSPELALPVGDPLLEGTQTLSGVDGVGVSYVASAALVHPRGHQVGVAFRPPWALRGAGEVAFSPSDDLAAQVDGQVAVELVMPAHLHLSGRIELDRLTLLPDVEWVGWRRTGRNTATVSGLRLTSADPVLDGVLGTSGLDQADFLRSQEGDQSSDLHWRDVVNVGLAASVRATPRLDLRVGVWRSPGALELDWVHPANLDFTVWNLRAGARFDAAPALTLAASADLYAAQTRTVTTSVYSQTDPASPAQALPRADGRYAATLWRAGLTVVVRLPESGARRTGQRTPLDATAVQNQGSLSGPAVRARPIRNERGGER
jgi:long-subunit fatty acid transport protein